VHQARAEALEQLALSDDDNGFGSCARGYVIEPVRWFSYTNQTEEEKRPAGEEPAGDQQRQCERDPADLSFLTSAEIAGTISFRSPTTA